MLSNRISFGLAAFLLVVSAGIMAHGQDHELAGLDLFEPADIRPYDNWAEPKNGLFFTFDGLWWHISPPAKTSIGDPTLTPTVFTGPTLNDSFVEQNSLDTSAENLWKWGDRMELGYIEGHHGFMFTSITTESQTSETSAPNAYVVFNDPAFGPNGSHYLDTVLSAPGAVPVVIGETPINFSSIYVQNKSRLDGVEALYIYRESELPLGGTLEFTAGGRYLELKDQFWVDARGGNLTDSYWNTTSHNEISGPEVGIRWFQPCGRLGISAEGRFTAGANFQSVLQDGILAAGLTPGQNTNIVTTLPNGNTVTSQYPTLMGATSFTHSTHWVEFSPIIEFRVEAHMQLTNIIAVKAGYTGLFVNNVVRAADMVDYTVPSMGITRNLDGNLQPVYAQGLTLSVEFNR
ncbi:MAG: BBP7 family outer membrane beta-barrel protein [Thermoguttaceae bacterium]|jgi:hypothetical protein